MGSNFVTPPDNIIQYPIRRLSGIIARKLTKTNITPNQITFFRMIIMLSVLYLFSTGNYTNLIIGAILFEIFEILDHVDGDLARLKNLSSQIGFFMEQVIDSCLGTIYGLFGFCIALGIYNQTKNFSIWFILMAMMLGVILTYQFKRTFNFVDKDLEGKGHYISIKNTRGVKGKIIVLLRIIYIWEPQVIVFCALFYRPAKTYLGLNLLFWGMVFLTLLHQLPWLYIVITKYKGIKNE